MKRTHQILGYGLSAVAAAVSAQLHAQSAGLEEIVVTAQKRTESAQEIPIAIDVITGDAFIREGVRDIKDIQKMSSELEINTNNQATVIGMRGMQQQGFAPTGDTLTAVHMDGAFLSSFWGLNGLMYDLERVEVLAGPQGTLYGRNTAAGAINLITKRPGREFEGNAAIEYGDYDTTRLIGGVTMPVSDTLSLRLAGQKYTRDALFTDGSAEQDQYGVRLSALWTPNDQNELFFTADYSENNGTSESGTLYAVEPGTSATTRFVVPNDPYDNVPYWQAQSPAQFFSGVQEQENWGVMGQYTHNFDAFSTILQYSHRDLEGVGRGATKSATAISQQITPNVVTSDTAELRFVSTGTGAFEWVGGVFYTEADNLGWNATPLTTAFGSDPVTGLEIPLCPCSGFYPNSGEMYSYAAFGQTTWTPDSNQQLHLTAGLRYTYDWKSGDLGYYVGSATQIVEISRFVGEGNWDAVQYKLGAEYELTDDSMIYASVATGYKSGGFAYGPTPELKPEELLAYEIGTKNRFLNNALQLNASMWYYDYTDLEVGIQFQLSPPYSQNPATGQDVTSAPTVASVGKANLAGASIDADWLFTENDQLGYSVTYVWSEIKDGFAPNPDGTQRQIFWEGQRIGDAPKWQMIGRYSHTFNFANGSRLNPQLKYQWQSAKYDGGLYQAAAFNATHVTPGQQIIPSRGILDFSLRFTPASDRWDVTAYLNNATDELNIRTLTYQNNPGNYAYGTTLAQLGEPRTWGVILAARF